MRFLLDGDQVIEERSGSDALLRQYIWGQYVDELVQQREYEKAPVGQPYADWYPITDLLHRTVALTDDKVCQGISSRPLHAKFVEVYDTDIYGRTKIYKDAGPSGYWFDDDDTPTFDPRCRYLFTGREYDPETGLYYYRARYYHPDLGRFISRDPLLYDGGDMNLYGYAAGNPAIYTDPSGEFIPLIVLGFLALAALGTGAVVYGTYRTQMALNAGSTQNGGINYNNVDWEGVQTGQRWVAGGQAAAWTGIAGAAGWALPGLGGLLYGASPIAGSLFAVAGLGMTIYGGYGSVREAVNIYQHWGEMDALDQTTSVVGLVGPWLAGGLTARMYGAANFRIGFLKGARWRLAGNPRSAMLYRGVNRNHEHYQQATRGTATANRAWWRFWVRSSTPYEHNSVENGTLNSPYTGWSTNRAVAETFALRPHNGGVILRTRVPGSRLTRSPNLKSVVLFQSGEYVSEAEVLVRGTVRGARVEDVP